MPRVFLFAAAIQAAFAAVCFCLQPDGRYQAWLDEEVAYIISDAEKDYFLSLKSDSERDRFIEAFWKLRDPTVETEENEYRIEHYLRLKLANDRYGEAGRPGRLTDMGRVRIILGQPAKQRIYYEDYSNGPIVAWLYPPDWTCGIKYFYYMVFFKPSPGAESILYSPMRHGPQALAPGSDPQKALDRLLKRDPLLGRLSISLLPREHHPIMMDNPAELRRALSRINSASDKVQRAVFQLRNRNQRQRLWRLKDLMRGAAVAAEKVEYAEIPIHVKYRFPVLREGANTSKAYYLFQIDSKDWEMNPYLGRSYGLLKVEATVMNENGRVVKEIEQYYRAIFSVHEIEMDIGPPIICMDGIELPEGRFSIRLVIKNPYNHSYFSIEDQVTIPPIRGRFLSFYSPLLLIGPLGGGESSSAEAPFSLYGTNLFPNTGGSIKAGSDVCVYYQLYFPRRDRVSSVNVRYLLFAGDREVWRHSVALDQGLLKPGGIITRATCLPIEELRTGSYTLRIIAHSLSPPEARAQIDFTVLPKDKNSVRPRWASPTD